MQAKVGVELGNYIYIEMTNLLTQIYFTFTLCAYNFFICGIHLRTVCVMIV